MSHRYVSLVIRTAVTLPLILLTGFACFGFLAASEYAAWPAKLPLLVGYSVSGVTCLGSAIVALRPLPGGKSQPGRTVR